MSLSQDQDFQNTWRYEFKYHLSYLQYHQLKNACQPYIYLDQFSDSSPEKKYFVRSLYFDTLDYQIYNEKIGGNHSRAKFRIRTYNKQLQTDSVIRIEIKFREGDKSGKHGAIVSPEAFTHFMKTYHWDCDSGPAMIEFERNLHAKTLRPKVLVEYLREGFVSRSKEKIRITFDHHVQSAQTKMLYPSQAFFRPHNPHQIVLEIKCRDSQPDWIKQIVEMQQLKIVTNSKYCQGIEITQNDFINHALRV